MIELAKLVGWLLSPLSIALLLALSAWVFRNRRPRGARRLVVAGVLVLWAGSTPLVADWLGAPLENRYASLPIREVPKADAIVVLGGAVIGAFPPARPNNGLGPAADRVWQAAALYRAGKAPWMIVAAGELRPRDGLQVEADAMRDMLVVLGVPPERIRMEGASRNTRENAANTRASIAQLGVRSVLLVTSAQHLPRAVGTFEKAWSGMGVRIVPVPAEVGSPADYFTIWAFMPSPEALRRVTRSLKEYAGIAVLGIMG